MIEAELEFAIRPYDVDMAGVVSNIVYVRWLEDLRMELLRRHFPAGEMLRRNLLPVVARTEIDYRLSLRFLDRCTGRMRVTELGRTSAKLHAEFRNGDNLLVAEARQIGVFVDAATARPAPLPDEIRELFGGKSVMGRGDGETG